MRGIAQLRSSQSKFKGANISMDEPRRVQGQQEIDIRRRAWGVLGSGRVVDTQHGLSLWRVLRVWVPQSDSKTKQSAPVRGGGIGIIQSSRRRRWRH